MVKKFTQPIASPFSTSNLRTPSTSITSSSLKLYRTNSIFPNCRTLSITSAFMDSFFSTANSSWCKVSRQIIVPIITINPRSTYLRLFIITCYYKIVNILSKPTPHVNFNKIVNDSKNLIQAPNKGAIKISQNTSHKKLYCATIASYTNKYSFFAHKQWQYKKA